VKPVIIEGYTTFRLGNGFYIKVTPQTTVLQMAQGQAAHLVLAFQKAKAIESPPPVLNAFKAVMAQPFWR